MLNKHCEMARLVLGAVLFVAVASALPATPCPPGGSGSGDPEVPKGTSNGTILAPTQVYQPDTHASAETKYTPAELPVRNAAAILRAMRPIDRKRMEKMPTDYQLCYKCMQVSGKDAQEKDQAGSGKDAPGCNWLKGNEEKAVSAVSLELQSFLRARSSRPAHPAVFNASPLLDSVLRSTRT